MMIKAYRGIFKGLIMGISFMLLLQYYPLHAQKTTNLSILGIREDAERKYGPNADLLNGEKYQYTYKTTRGDPFLWAHNDIESSVQIKGRVYGHQKIRFDIYNQLMVLDFTDMSGGPGSVVLNKEWVDHLIIGELLFKKFSDEEGLEKFGQVIYEGKVSCFYYWEKKYLPDLHEGENQYYFSDPIRQSCIVVNGKTCAYTGDRSFIKCFAKQDHQGIKTYLKDNRIRVNKASDGEMQTLLDHINQSHRDED